MTAVRIYREAPIPVLTMTWCPKCGRTNMRIPFRNGGHYARGQICDGVPVKLVYREAEVQD